MDIAKYNVQTQYELLILILHNAGLETVQSTRPTSPGQSVLNTQGQILSPKEELHKNLHCRRNSPKVRGL